MKQQGTHQIQGLQRGFRVVLLLGVALLTLATLPAAATGVDFEFTASDTGTLTDPPLPAYPLHLIIDDDTPDAPELCSLAKAKMGDCLFEMSNQLIQIHGGIGMTDEFDAGLYLKRARVLETSYGNQAYHRDRYATLLGF